MWTAPKAPFTWVISSRDDDLHLIPGWLASHPGMTFNLVSGHLPVSVYMIWSKNVLVPGWLQNVISLTVKLKTMHLNPFLPKGLRYMILSITVKEITFWNGNLIYVIKNVSFTFDFKKLLESAQIYDRCSLEYFAMHSQFHSRGRTHDVGSVTRIAFKYKATGLRINFFKNDFSVYYFVFVYS